MINYHSSSPNLKIESEGPYEFMGAMYPDKCQREYLHHTMVLSGEITNTKEEDRMAQMVMANE